MPLVIGDSFIDWFKVIHSNISTLVEINGYLLTGCKTRLFIKPITICTKGRDFRTFSEKEPKYDVRFIVIEEKSTTLHYADDATIVITQHRCFKEASKEIQYYELYHQHSMQR